MVTTGPPQSVVAGKRFGLAVMAEDPFGNLDPNFAALVTFAAGGEFGGDTLGGTLTATANSGVVEFSNLTLDKVTSRVAILVSGATLPVATTDPIAVVAAAPVQLVLTSQPAANVTAGTSFSLTATAEDGFGNVASDYTGAVTVVSHRLGQRRSLAAHSP